MKKILFTILALGFSLIVLSGCQTREDSSDWLQGDWYSKDWNVTYTIIKQDIMTGKLEMESILSLNVHKNI